MGLNAKSTAYPTQSHRPPSFRTRCPYRGGRIIYVRGPKPLTKDSTTRCKHTRMPMRTCRVAPHQNNDVAADATGFTTKAGLSQWCKQHGCLQLYCVGKRRTVHADINLSQYLEPKKQLWLFDCFDFCVNQVCGGGHAWSKGQTLV